MNKMSRALATAGLITAFAWSWTAGQAAAAVGSAGLSQAVADSDVVQLAQQKKKKSGKSKNPKLSKDHQDKIRQHVPAEYHQYIPGMGGAAGAGGGIPGR